MKWKAATVLMKGSSSDGIHALDDPFPGFPSVDGVVDGLSVEVSASIGLELGTCDGKSVGDAVFSEDGAVDGCTDGSKEGNSDGAFDGPTEGLIDGSDDGVYVGLLDGCIDGCKDGIDDGFPVGTMLIGDGTDGSGPDGPTGASVGAGWQLRLHPQEAATALWIIGQAYASIFPLNPSCSKERQSCAGPVPTWTMEFTQTRLSPQIEHDGLLGAEEAIIVGRAVIVGAGETVSGSQLKKLLQPHCSAYNARRAGHCSVMKSPAPSTAHVMLP